MATRDTEGRREIEAAKQRLSIAKSHKTFLSKTLATAQASEDAAKKAWKRAKRAREEIQTQAKCSDKEVSDAQKFLAEAEKRWEVISIDIDDDTSKKDKESSSNKNKKRKYDHTKDDNTTDEQMNNVIEQSPTATRPVITANNIDSNRPHNVSEIIIQNCGTSSVNGTYKKDVDRYGYISFVKVGGTYAIYQHDNFWYISYWLGSHESSMIYYRTNRKLNGFMSLMHAEWFQIKGRAPLPKLNLRSTSGLTASSAAFRF